MSYCYNGNHKMLCWLCCCIFWSVPDGDSFIFHQMNNLPFGSKEFKVALFRSHADILEIICVNKALIVLGRYLKKKNKKSTNNIVKDTQRCLFIWAEFISLYRENSLLSKDDVSADTQIGEVISEKGSLPKSAITHQKQYINNTQDNLQRKREKRE